ncbi:MAG TPA: hypothetical protein VJN64_03390 [Terriglobales bacterium]|nr:hypothetical protein [Terriglobales bacterium]
MLINALTAGQNAKIYGPLIAAEIQKSQQQEQDNQQADQTYSELTAK